MRLRLPPYVHGYADRNGKARYYFRRAGFKRIALPGLPYSPEFMEAHSAAMAGRQIASQEIGAARTVPGTINALVVAYFNSTAFHALSPATKTTYRGLIERFRREHGDKRIATLDRRAVCALVGHKASTPAAAGNLLRILRILMRLAIDMGIRQDDPTTGVRPPKVRSDGFYAWSEDDIARFQACHPTGTRARLALDLLLLTGQRRGDVVRMGRQHIRNGVLMVRQQKTRADVAIPVPIELRASIEAACKDHLTFLVTSNGKPFTAAGFGNWFKETCQQAGLPSGCSAHGLRKAAARRLAEAGCTTHQIMAITGHKTLREVARYTESVDRTKLAHEAMERAATRTSSG